MDDNEDIFICIELRIVNKRGNTDQLEFHTFWNKMVCVAEMDGAGAQVFWHSEGEICGQQ